MINQAPVDRFTAAHFATGYLLGSLGWSAWSVTLAAVAWEIVERPLKEQVPQWFPHPSQDEPVNSLLDALAMMAGAELARSRPWTS